MRIHLFIPCFVDSLMPRAGIAMVRVLERLGHEVVFPEAQTCCGQPPYNSGCRREATELASRFFEVFDAAEQIVAPSASCVAMIRKGYLDLLGNDPERSRAQRCADRTFEFSEFLVDRLGVTNVGARYEGRVTFHDGCHGLRELKLREQPRQLLREVQGLELVEMDEAASCCGFGGSFAVKFPRISTAMGCVKADSIVATGAKAVVSCDPSCLLQIEGVLRKQGHAIECLHLAELLDRADTP